jgi:hypothetical protein
MNKLIPALIVFSALGIAGCRPPAEPEPEEGNTAMLSRCGDIDRLFEQMKAADSSFTYDESGNATMSKELWASIPPALREGLMKGIAYHGICASGKVGPQKVTVRATGSKEVLAEQTFSDFARGAAP